MRNKLTLAEAARKAASDYNPKLAAAVTDRLRLSKGYTHRQVCDWVESLGINRWEWESLLYEAEAEEEPC